MSIKYGSPCKDAFSDLGLGDSGLKTPSPVKHIYDDYLAIKKEESKIEMFEEATLAKLQEELIPTERDEEPRKNIPQPVEFQPSPVKPKSSSNRH